MESCALRRETFGAVGACGVESCNGFVGLNGLARPILRAEWDLTSEEQFWQLTVNCVRRRANHGFRV